MSEGHERRQHTRKVVDLVGEIQLGDEARRAVRLTEMSLGGSFIEIERVPPFGSELVVFFRLPGHNVDFALRSVVRWTSKTGIGVQFGTCGARETHALSLYLAARPAIPLPAQEPHRRPPLGMRALITPSMRPHPPPHAAQAPAASPAPVHATSATRVAAASGAPLRPAQGRPPAPPHAAAATPVVPAPVAPAPVAPAPALAPATPAPAAPVRAPAPLAPPVPAPAAPPPAAAATPPARAAVAPAASVETAGPSAAERQLAARVAELEAALAARDAQMSRQAIVLSEREELVARQDDALLECHDLIARLETELETRTVELRRVTEDRDERERTLGGLRAELATQSHALARKDEELAVLGARRQEGAEPARAAPPRHELRRIRGIGPTFARALEGMGIHHVAQVAAWGEDEIAAVAQRLKITAARIQREGWVARAASLLREGEGAEGVSRV